MDLGAERHQQSRGSRVVHPDDIGLRSRLSDLVHRYAARVDDRRLDDVAGLFADDGVLVLPDPPARLDAHLEVIGQNAIARHLSVLGSLDLTVHQVVGEVYDRTGPGSATGRVTCVAHHVSGGRDVEWLLHYRDQYVEREDAWVFARRSLSIDAITTRRVPHHR
jgi:hypothetical protein